MRLFLALSCFFRVLCGRPLPPALLPPPAAPPRAEPKGARLAASRGADLEQGAVALLALLQRDGRLVDFLQEDVDGFSDDQVGAAVRDVHRGCRKALREHLMLEPVREEREGSLVRVDEGFDATALRLTGVVAGTPPFRGTLRHPGWRATRVELPPAGPGIVAPAEIEVQ